MSTVSISGDTIVQRTMAAYTAAVRARDADAFAALYAENVRVFDLWGEWSYDGLPAWRAMAQQWFASLDDQTVTVEFDNVRVTAAPGFAVADAFVCYRANAGDGRVLHAMQNRLTWVLAGSVEQGWKIVHEHTSAPLHPETFKGLLRLA